MSERNGPIHLCAGAGYTACRLWIPELAEDERYWYPPHDANPLISPARLPDPAPHDPTWTMARVRRVFEQHPVTCEWCLADKPAPLCSKDPASLTMYVVYDHPRDFPDEFVCRARKVYCGRGDQGVARDLCARGKTLDEVREQLRASPGGLGLCRIPRKPNDDPTIVEVWL